jgi:2-dehydro-3-deoxyglucarate aldolase/4-hydroxy-2-oxoheptanedioate aldolase
MTMHNPRPELKARLQAGEAVGCHWLMLGAPQLAEMAAEGEPDALVIDMQHGPWSRASLDAALGLIAGRAPTLARVQDASDFAIGSALDAGCCGVIAPMVNSSAEAASVVAATHFPPKGRRSSGGLRVGAPGYREAAAANMIAAVMIETREALDAAEAIAATPGLDLIFIGPQDLSLSLGVAPGSEPFEAALKQILTAGKAAGVPVGLYTAGPEAAIARAAEGFQFLVVANDGQVARAGARDAWRQFAKRRG